MNTLECLANKLILCAVESTEQYSKLLPLIGKDKEPGFAGENVTGALSRTQWDSQKNSCFDYSFHSHLYLAIVRAIIAAIHVRAGEQPKQALVFLTSVEEQGLSLCEKETLKREFKSPAPVQGIARLVQSSHVAALIYTLSLLTLDVNDASAKSYLDELAGVLDLSSDTIASVLNSEAA